MKLNCGQSTFVIFFVFKKLCVWFLIFFEPLCWARNAINAKCYKCWLRLSWFNMVPKAIVVSGGKLNLGSDLKANDSWSSCNLRKCQFWSDSQFFHNKEKSGNEGELSICYLTISDPRKYSILLDFALRKSRIWGRKEQEVWKVKEIWVFEEYEPLPFDIRCR